MLTRDMIKTAKVSRVACSNELRRSQNICEIYGFQIKPQAAHFQHARNAAEVGSNLVSYNV